MRIASLLLAAAAAQQCAELPAFPFRPVASYNVLVFHQHVPQGFDAVRWPHETAAEAAARFCREQRIDQQQRAYEPVSGERDGVPFTVMDPAVAAGDSLIP